MLLSASCEVVFTSSKVANLFPFNVFFIVGNKKNLSEPFGTYYSYLRFPLSTPAFLGFKEPFSQDSLLRERNDSVK